MEIGEGGLYIGIWRMPGYNTEGVVASSEHGGLSDPADEKYK